MAQEVNVVALVKGKEKYVYIYDVPTSPCLRQTLEHHAGDPNLSLNGFDVKVLLDKLEEDDKELSLPESEHRWSEHLD